MPISQSQDKRSSDRRREQRMPAQEPVTIVLLGPPGGPPIPGTVIDLSGSGLRLLSPRPLPSGALVKIEAPNRLVLGEVLRSDPAGDAFTLGVKVKHFLGHLADLDRLNRQIQGLQNEEVPQYSYIMNK
jgi:hypothetical protein